ncbi:MAG: hypothetical protein J3Q66DRAFT_19806 [Benniella sp.]|nr:MAG: hypothetical protein J3Q66DRAFT_19806 [Benniella sp.]
MRFLHVPCALFQAAGAHVAPARYCSVCAVTAPIDFCVPIPQPVLLSFSLFFSLSRTLSHTLSYSLTPHSHTPNSCSLTPTTSLPLSHT